MGIIRYKDIAYGGGSSVTEGYYKVADGKFYEHFDGTTYSDEITGEDGILYLDLSTNNLYRWSTGASLFVLVGKSTLASLNDTNIATPTDGQAIEYNGTSSKWVNVAKKAADTPTFTEATGTRSNIVGSGETMATILGKIKRWFADLKDLAFIGKDGASSTKYLRGDGTWQAFPSIPAAQVQSDWNQTDSAQVDYIKNKPTIPTNTDEKVKQENTTGSADYRVLLSNGANDTTETKTARKSTNLKFNPSTGALSAIKLVLSKALNRLLTGTGTAGQDKGSGQTNRYVPAEWKFNAGITPTDGDEISIKIPVAGISYGVWLSVDNGTTYYPVGRNDTSRLQTQFANGTTIHLVFQTNANMSMYARGGADSSTTYTGNYWKVVNYYDSNTTYSVVSTSANGLAPKVTDTSKFLKGDGTWAAPTDNTKLPLAGGTMTGQIATQNVLDAVIIPQTDMVGNIGSDAKRYDKGYFNDLYLGKKAGNGSSIRFRTSSNSNETVLKATAASVGVRSLELPDETGTLATQEYVSTNYGTITTGTITKASRITSGTLDNTQCQKIGKMVVASGRIHSMSSVSASGDFFQIPTGFRPTNGAIGMGYIKIGSTFNPCPCSISTNGVVGIYWSASQTTDQVFFFAVYPIS